MQETFMIVVKCCEAQLRFPPCFNSINPFNFFQPSKAGFHIPMTYRSLLAPPSAKELALIQKCGNLKASLNPATSDFARSWASMRILSIDGGGIRGIIPGQVLVSLEQKLQQLSGDSNRRIADAFDMVAGTSTGGILTCLYLCPDAAGKPKFSAADAVDLYLQYGGDIFDVSIFKSITSLGGLTDDKYSAAALESVLHKYLGELKLSQLLRPCLVTAYDITRREARFFNSADVPVEGIGRDFLVRDVARATSAAPTYFPPAHITALDNKVYPLVDGGVFANNPTMCACVEAFGYDPRLTVPDLKILSLGTGSSDKPYHYAEARNWGKIQWAVPVLDILLAGVSETVDYQLAMLFSSAKCPNQYLRVEADLADFPDADKALDNASQANMQALKKVGETLATRFDAPLTALARSLLGIP
jgi:patatin-like phospholipase/acyl hydrolase